MAEHKENEMERIQRNLEGFLDQEPDVIEIYKNKNTRIIREADLEEQEPERPAREPERLTKEQKRPARASSAPAGNSVTYRNADNRTRKDSYAEFYSAPRRSDSKERDRRGKDSLGQISREEKTGELSRKGKTKKKKNQGQKKLFIFLLLVVLCILGWVTIISKIYGKMSYVPSQENVGGVLSEDGVTNILLIGSDSRTEGDEGRSDAMILLSISSKTKTIHMTSLLRDMYVEIPGHDGNRLNAAYAYGGPELLLETVSLNLGIEVNHYVVVNFQAFANLVDAVGGVDLELSNEEVQWVNAYLNEYNLLRNMPIDTDYLDPSLSGMIHLNGPQALAYTRNRYIGSDFGRTQRQRKVLSAVIKKLPLAVVMNPKELVNGLFPNLTTNLTRSECMMLSTMGGRFVTYDLVQLSVPMTGTYTDANIRGMAVLQVDFAKNTEYLRQEIYGE